jgi:hypothetical protein
MKSNKFVGYATTIGGAAFALMFAVDLVRFPGTQSDARIISAYARGWVGNSRIERVVFEQEAGKQYRIHCVYARAMCDYVSGMGDKRLDVEVAKISVSGEYWLVSARDGGREIVDRNSQAILYKEARTHLLVRFFVCAGAAILAAYFVKLNR